MCVAQSIPLPLDPSRRSEWRPPPPLRDWTPTLLRAHSALLHWSSRLDAPGKTQVWNAVGERPEVCDVLEQIAQAEDLRARVWKGSNIPTSEQGVRVLGTLVGHVDHVETQLTQKLGEHSVFF